MSDPQAPEGQSRPQRPARLVFTQAVLTLQGFAALFATLALGGLARGGAVDAPAALVWSGGLGLMAALLLAAGMQARPGGTVVGSVLQAPMLAAGLISLPVALVGGMFVMLWVTALRLGGRIDRERAERSAAEGD